jgi:hypothetical protein
MKRGATIRVPGQVVTPYAPEQAEGIPPLNRNCAGGSNVATVTGKVRPGAACERIFTVSPIAIRPSTASTPESQAAQCAPSLSTAHTASGLAAILAVAS